MTMATQAILLTWEEAFNEPEPTPESIQKHFENETSSKRWAWVAKENYGLNYKEEYKKHRRYRKDLELSKCGEIRYKFSAAKGVAVYYEYSCKHFDECKRCGIQRKRKTIEELEQYSWNDKEHVVCDESKAKKLVRGVDKNKYKRYPLDDGRVLLVADKDVFEGSKPLKDEVYDLGRSISLSNKRISGSLVAKVVEEEVTEETAIIDFEQLEDELFNPEIKVDHREFSIDFDFEDKSKPQGIKEVEAIVQQEAQIEQHPQTEEQLQDALYVMEQTTKKVCERYGLSFNFCIKKQSIVKKNDIDWKWLKEKLNS